MELMSSRDIEANYVGTWLGWTRDNGTIMPAFVDDVANLDNEYGLWLKPYDVASELYIRRKRVSMLDSRLVWEHPDSGYYATSRGGFTFMRSQGRQYRRGVRESMIHVSSIGNASTPPAEFGSVLHHVYNEHPFASWGSVTQLASRGNDFVAVVSRMLAVVRDEYTRYSNPVVLLRGKPIAEIVDGTVHSGNDNAMQFLTGGRV